MLVSQILGGISQMPGGGRYGYRWIWTEEPPLYYKVLLWITFGQFWVEWLTLMTLAHRARRMADASHPAELTMKGGRHYYLAPGIGWYLNNDLWIFFASLAILALITVIRRDRIERID
jgi:hypothetical protein